MPVQWPFGRLASERASKRTRFAALVVLLTALTVSIAALVEYAENSRFRQTQKANVLERLAVIRAKLEGALASELDLSKGLVTTIHIRKGIDPDTFSRVAALLFRETKYLRNIALSRGTVVEHVYPVSGNERVIGLDYSKNASQWPAVRRAIENRSLVVAGPVNLIQGGVGIIGRIPVFLPSEDAKADGEAFYGILAVVIDIPKLLAAAGISDGDPHLSVAIRGKDGLGEKGEVFYGDPGIFTRESVSMTVHFSDNSWVLAATPRQGWDTPSPLIPSYRMGFSLVWLIILGLLFLQHRETMLRLAADQERVKSEERLRSLFELAADTILQGDPRGDIIGANRSATQLTGYAPEELIGMNIGRLFSPEEQAAKPLRYDLLKEGKTIRTERLLTRKDGSRVPIDMNSQMMPDGTYLTFIRDMAERRQAEAELRASEEKFSTAFQHAPLLMSISALEDGRYIEVNDTYCALTGYSREEAIGHTSIELGLLAPEERERLISRIHAQGRIQEIELALVAKDGRQVHCLYSMEKIEVEGTQRLLSIALDVTEKKRLQADLDRTQRLESLGVLAGGLAHDFNNILTSILGNLTLAQTLLKPAGQAANCLEACEKAAVRASQVVQQLMTFARGGAPVKTLVDVVRILDESVSFVLRGSAVKAEVQAKDSPLGVEADEGQLSQAFNNLLINAAQSMPAGGTVEIRARHLDLNADNPYQLPPGSYVAVAIQDHGIGIPKEHLGRIFDPYFTTKARGTGLGLASVYSIVKRHGGFITVQSTPGAGTEFTVLLPASEKVPEAAQPSPRAEPVVRGQGRVLVMDDEDFIREVATQMLTNLGYEAVCVADGHAALEAMERAHAQGSPFRAAILDLTIPGGMGGKEVATLAGSRWPQTPLLASSGYSTDPVMSEYHKHGFVGALPKPYRYAAFARELQRILPPGPEKDQTSGAA